MAVARSPPMPKHIAPDPALHPVPSNGIQAGIDRNGEPGDDSDKETDEIIPESPVTTPRTSARILASRAQKVTIEKDPMVPLKSLKTPRTPKSLKTPAKSPRKRKEKDPAPDIDNDSPAKRPRQLASTRQNTRDIPFEKAASREGISRAEIQLLGRWKSDAVDLYINEVSKSDHKNRILSLSSASSAVSPPWHQSSSLAPILRTTPSTTLHSA